MGIAFYIVSFIILTFHSFLNFKLCSILSEKVRFHKSTVYIACLLNGSLAYTFFTTQYVGSTTPYFLCTAILLIELLVLYKGGFLQIVGVGIGSLIHLFVLRGLAVSSMSLIFEIPFSEVMQNPSYFPWLNLVSFALQLITLLLFINLIPMDILRHVMADKSFYTPLFYFSVLLNGFIIINADLFYIDVFSARLAIHEIIIILGILLFFYIMLILLLWIANLGILKEKNIELENQIEKDKVLTSAVFNFAEIVIEANCTKDSIMRIVVNSEEKEIPNPDLTIHDFFCSDPRNHLYPDDFDVMNRISAEYLLESLQSNNSELVYEFRSTEIDSYIDDPSSKASDAYLWYRMRINIELPPVGGDVIAIFTIDEIDKAKQQELRLRKKAETDPLTGAYNNKTFAKKVNENIKNDVTGSLYMFDLDNFKGINDNMGHQKGDEVLIEVYNKVSALFREQDLVGRIGGDEFVVFMIGPQKDSTIIKKAVGILNTINKTYHADNGVSINITGSVGIATTPKDGTDFETLFKASDVAMYHSKSVGKNTYTVYDKSKSNSFKPREKDEYTRTDISE